MNTLRYFTLIPLMVGIAAAQMPSSFDASGRSTQAQSGVSNDDPNRVGETPPQMFGMELPLLDPSNDTMSYGGAKFDVGNNAVVRERFEKFLRQTPDDSEASRIYRKKLESILDYTQRYSKSSDKIGSKTLVKIGTGLYDMSSYPGDGEQSGTLASAIVSALDVQRANRRRDQANAELDKEIDKLITKTNTLTNRNTQKGSRSSKTSQGGGSNGGYTSHTYLIAANTSKIAEKKAKQPANEAASLASLQAAKINYQALVVWFLAQRRFDHAVIGARVYRHVFKDGDTEVKLDKNSDAYKMAFGISGLPPTINTVDALANNARREVQQSIDAVFSALAQNKLGEATNRLITAVAAGEYMQCVATFPSKDRQRIAEYWTLRKRSLTALNARDYDNVERIADEMKKLDTEFDDSLLRSYTSGKKRQSNFALRSARKALAEGNDEEFRKHVTEAAVIWPLNPNLDKGEEEIAKLDSFEPQKAEFKVLVERKEYRTIYNERERFKVVATDPELEKKYTEVLEHVARIDATLAELESFAKQDRTIGPCTAYEKLDEMKKNNELYAADKKFMNEYNRYASEAHDFVEAIRYAEDCEARGEHGSALACYYRARCFYPNSNLAKAGADRVTAIIVSAQY